MSRHRGIYEPGLNRYDAHPGGMQSIPQTLKKNRDRSLRRAIDVIGLAPTITCYRSDDGDRAVPLRLQTIADMRKEQDDADRVGVQLRQRQHRIPFASPLVTQRAMCDQHYLKPSQSF